MNEQSSFPLANEIRFVLSVEGAFSVSDVLVPAADVPVASVVEPRAFATSFAIHELPFEALAVGVVEHTDACDFVLVVLAWRERERNDRHKRM